MKLRPFNFWLYLFFYFAFWRVQHTEEWRSREVRCRIPTHIPATPRTSSTYRYIPIQDPNTDPHPESQHISQSWIPTQIPIQNPYTYPNPESQHISQSRILTQIPIQNPNTYPNPESLHISQSRIPTQIPIQNPNTDPNPESKHMSQSRIPTHPPSLRALGMTFLHKNGRNSLNNWLIFNPKPPLESWESQLSSHEAPANAPVRLLRRVR